MTNLVTVRLADAQVGVEYAKGRLPQKRARVSLAEALSATTYHYAAALASEARRILLAQWGNGGKWDIDQPVL